MPAVAQTASVALRRTTWHDAITLDQVDPALGIQSLMLSLDGTVASTAYVTNYDLMPAAFDSFTTGVVSLSRPDGSGWLAAAPTAYFHGALPATFGGVAMPAELSGSGSAKASAGYAPAQTGSADAALLIGTGQVTLPVAASARIHATGPGNMAAQFTSRAAADVSLTAATAQSTSSGVTFQGGTYQFSLLSGAQERITSSLYGQERTTSQTLVAADDLTGATSALTFDGFNPLLGVLRSVELAVAMDASGSAQVENLDPVAGSATIGQAATVTLKGADGATLASSTASLATTRQLAAFDGTADFTGDSAAASSQSVSSGDARPSTATIRGAGLQAFEAGPVVLQAARTGVTTIDAPGNFNIATALQAGAQVTVTYHYVAPDLHYTNTATGEGGVMQEDIYTGPVAGLQRQHIWAGSDPVAMSSDAPDVFLKGGSGDDALAVSGGSNVLDGGSGSNFLAGASGGDGGHDIFFLDARGGATTWSTLANFHQGDKAVVFGFQDGVSTVPWTARDGAAGYGGLTMHSEIGGAGTGVNASLTFAGIDQATADARWTVTAGTLSPGTSTATGYLLIAWDH